MNVPPQIFDNHGRPISYLRLAVTDRCNLRCFYCMPEHGIQYLPRKELLTYEEILRITRILVGFGISKVRITGGEPFVRQDLIELLEKLAAITQIKELCVTTNGVLTKPFIPRLKKLGIRSINLSLDTLDPERFKIITRRDEYGRVMDTFYSFLNEGFRLKINCVVMEDKNIEDIIPLVLLSKENDVSVRFIEEMPFNGEGAKYAKLKWTHDKILNHIRAHFDSFEKLSSGPNETSQNYRISGFRGDFGIIAAYTRTFCGTCNRIRITSSGLLKTCLYDHGVLDLKKLIRSGKSDGSISNAFLKAFRSRPKDGFEAESNRLMNAPIHESMSTIGG